MKMSKLKKMKMPEKKGEDLSGMEEMDSMELSEEAPSEEMPEDMAIPSEEAPASPELDALSDEELMAEIKKRGLMSQLGEEEVSEEEIV